MSNINHVPSLEEIMEATPRASDHEIAEELLSVLARLRLEAIHYRAKRIGEQFLWDAIERAERVILKAQKHGIQYDSMKAQH